jgi:hypothetical protein
MGDSMSTIINATTTNGVVIQPDNSGSLVLQTNSGTTALTIDTSQNATFAKAISALAIGGNVTQSNSVTASFAGSSTAETYTDTGASLSLNAGTYLITTTAILAMQSQSGTTVAYRQAKLALTDNSNNVQRVILCGGATTGFGTYTGTLSFVLTVSSTTTYKTRFSSENNSGTPTISNLFLYAEAPYPHNIIAIRLT